jgi:hypothetical protein
MVNNQISKEEVSELKLILQDKEIIDQDEIINIKKLRNHSIKSEIIYGRLVIRINSNLSMCLNSIEDKLKDSFENYLKNLEIINLERLFNDYNNGESIGDYYKEMRIKENLRENKLKYDEMISLFFKLFGEASLV